MSLSRFNSFDNFDPASYLREYYSRTDGENEGLLSFHASAWKRIGEEGTGKTGDFPLVEIGGGPTIYQLISAAPHVTGIDFYEFAAANRNEIIQWKESDSQFWDPFIKVALGYETGRTPEDGEVLERRELIRKLLRSIETCDLFSSPCIDSNRIPVHGFPVLSSSFCAESITSNRHQFYYAIHSLLSLSAPGGHLLITLIEQANSYQAGDYRYPAYPVTEEEARLILINAGFTILESRLIPAEEEQGYRGLLCIHAKNTNRPTGAPLFEALQKHVETGVVSFHVPGHKGGAWNAPLRILLGQGARYDLNAMQGLDDLSAPGHEIMDSQNLAAKTFHASSAFFEINGASGGVQAMLLSILSPGDQLILQRNSHRSAFAALILGRLRPTYLPFYLNRDTGLIRPVTPEEVEAAILANPEARAVLIVSPDYFGQSADLEQIATICEGYGKFLLVDEAHGSHFYFHPYYPGGAMDRGAHLSVASLHKTAGSPTQTALLLASKNTRPQQLEWVNDVHNLLRSSSASYLLMAGLDLARQNLDIRGRIGVEQALALAAYLEEKLARLQEIYSVGSDSWFKDPTRIVLKMGNLDLNGFQLEKILRQKYRIQVEMSSFQHVVLILTAGNTVEDMEKLVAALEEVERNTPLRDPSKGSTLPTYFRFPEFSLAPSDAFHRPYQSIPLEETAGKVSAEFIMIYPPGIPLVVPGETIDETTIEQLKFIRNSEAFVQGAADPNLVCIRVIA